MFWIVEKKSQSKIGHVSLDRGPSSTAQPVTLPPELAISPGSTSDESLRNIFMSINSFYLKSPFQGTGVGRIVMDQLESMAIHQPYGHPECRAIHVTALDRRHLYDMSPTWQDIWNRTVANPPPNCVEDWYRRRGYKTWKVALPWYYDALDGSGDRLALRGIDLWKEIR